MFITFDFQNRFFFFFVLHGRAAAAAAAAEPVVGRARGRQEKKSFSSSDRVTARVRNRRGLIVRV